MRSSIIYTLLLAATCHAAAIKPRQEPESGIRILTTTPLEPTIAAKTQPPSNTTDLPDDDDDDDLEQDDPNHTHSGEKDCMLWADHNTTTITVEDEDDEGPQDLDYWTTEDGFAVIHGDVVYDTEHAMQLASRQSSSNHTVRGGAHIQRRAFFRSSEKWPGATVTFKYESKAVENDLRGLINQAIALWRTKAPYMKFVRRPNGAAKVPGVLTIRSRPGGCYATVGFQKSGGGILNLAQPGCGLHAAVHELGHTLGLQHEATRPDRNEFVSFRCENVAPRCNNGGGLGGGRTCCNASPAERQRGCCSAMSNFKLAKSGDFTGSYDFTSIMQYPNGAFAVAGKKTLVSKDPNHKRLGSVGDAPTTGDCEKICKHYAEACPWS